MDIYDKIREYGIMPLVTLECAQHALLLGQALTECALPIVEITFRTEAAEEAIRILKREYPQLLVGAGTVLSEDMAERAIEAGAEFVLSPGINPEVVRCCQNRGIAVIPGCMTPSDLELAKRLGVKVVKIFPVSQMGGLDMLKAIAAPFGDLRFVVTGGVHDDNVAEYLSFQRIISCGGSWMIKKEKLEAGDLAGLKMDIQNSLTKMLQLRFGHLGVNDHSGGKEEYAKLLNLEQSIFDDSNFVGKEVEFIKENGRGTKGHIAIKTGDIKRAILYYQRKGIKIDESSIKKEVDGEIFLVYFKEEVGGFAVHLLQDPIPI